MTFFSGFLCFSLSPSLFLSLSRSLFEWLCRVCLSLPLCNNHQDSWPPGGLHWTHCRERQGCGRHQESQADCVPGEWRPFDCEILCLQTGEKSKWIPCGLQPDHRWYYFFYYLLLSCLPALPLSTYLSCRSLRHISVLPLSQAQITLSFVYPLVRSMFRGSHPRLQI